MQEKMTEQLIYESIKQAILQHKLRPNTQLIEDQLAETFGVSRTPIRNVLRKLSYKKLVKVIPHRGTFVYCPDVEEAKQIFKIREDLEVSAVRLVCQNVQESQIKEMYNLIEKERDASYNEKLFEALDFSLGFHLKIAEFTNNRYYYRYLEELISLVFVIVSFYGNRRTFSGWDEHFELLDIIKTRDEDAAADYMRRHLGDVGEGVYLEESNAGIQSIGELFKTSI